MENLPESTQEKKEGTPSPFPPLPPTPDEKTPSALGVTSDELGGIKVSVWHPWKGAQEETLQAILAEFNRTNRWGIAVQASGYEGFGSLDDAMDLALASETLPDVIIDYGYMTRHWDQAGAVVDLSPYITDSVWGLGGDEQDDFIPAFWSEDLVTQADASQAKRLGVPYYRSAYVLFYNQSWAKELGYSDPPLTPEDFRKQACDAAKVEDHQANQSIDGSGGFLITSQPGGLVGWIYAFGGNIANPGEQNYLFNTAEVRKAFEYLKNLQDSDCAWSGSGVNPLDEFANRRALFVVGSIFDIPAQQEALIRAGNPDEWMVIPFPSGKQPVIASYGPSLSVTRSNPGKQLAGWLVIEWLVYPPNQAQWVRALEAYPTRLTTNTFLTVNASGNTQWMQALELLPSARSEPSLDSWRIVRWTLSDVMDELFAPEFNIAQIPMLLEKLDEIAAEITVQVH